MRAGDSWSSSFSSFLFLFGDHDEGFWVRDGGVLGYHGLAGAISSSGASYT